MKGYDVKDVLNGYATVKRLASATAEATTPNEDVIDLAIALKSLYEACFTPLTLGEKS